MHSTDKTLRTQLRVRALKGKKYKEEEKKKVWEMKWEEKGR
jgi:hypothetical protein